MTSLRHNRGSRHRWRRPSLSKCCCQRGSNCKQKSSRSQNSATISVTRTSLVRGVVVALTTVLKRFLVAYSCRYAQSVDFVKKLCRTQVVWGGRTADGEELLPGITAP